MRKYRAPPGWSHRQAASPAAVAQRAREAATALQLAAIGHSIREIARALQVSRMTAHRRLEQGIAMSRDFAELEAGTRCGRWIEERHQDPEHPWRLVDHSHPCRRRVRPGERWCWQHAPSAVRARRMRARRASPGKHSARIG